MLSGFVAALSDESFRATAGVSANLFENVFTRFCGVGTPMNERYRSASVFSDVYLITSQRWLFARWKLYHLLYYYKTYPTNRHLAVLTGARDIRHYRATMVRRTHFLAGRMRTLMETAWNERWSCPNPVADIFPGAMGAADTFPTRSA
jgi:hypothetical protein